MIGSEIEQGIRACSKAARQQSKFDCEERTTHELILGGGGSPESSKHQTLATSHQLPDERTTEEARGRREGPNSLEQISSCVRVERHEIGGVWTPSFAAEAPLMPQTSSTGTVGSSFVETLGVHEVALAAQELRELAGLC